jgi:hypothetical protein
MPSAFVALARYQRQEDVPLILGAFQAGISHSRYKMGACMAAESFPDSQFLEPLLGILADSSTTRFNYPEWRSLFNALMHYRGDSACMQKLFGELNKPEEEYSARLPILYASAHRFRDSGMSELLWKLWEQFGYIAADDFKMFLEVDSTRAYQLTRQSLDSIGHTLEAARSVIEKLQFNQLAGYSQYLSGEVEVELIFAMLSHVGERDSVFTRSILSSVLAVDELREAQSIMRYLKHRPDKFLVDAMFRRLHKEDNPHVFIPLTEALIAFEDEVINRKLQQARIKNKDLRTGWGGEEYTRLMESLER